jgi:hypothetical protein
MEIRKFVLMTAFRLSMLWDLISTFLGTLLILGHLGFVPIGISLVGTLIVGAFNFSTKIIWEPRHLQRSDQILQLNLLRVAWLMAILFDFLTSLTCNAMYVAFRRIEIGTISVEFNHLFRNLTGSQTLIVLFVTVLVTISPMMVGYLRDTNLDFLG